MYPILLSIGPVSLHSYGILLALAIITAFRVIEGLAQRNGLNSDHLRKVILGSFFVGLVGAKLFYLLLVPGFSVTVADIFGGGFVFYGAPLTAIPFGAWLLRRSGLPVWKVLDYAAIGLSIGQVIGRVGCFLAGCCHGVPTNTWIGLRFESPLVADNLRGTYLHPTQLYEAGAMFLVFLFLRSLEKKKRFNGQVFIWYMLLYAIIRSIIEVFRGDVARGVYWDFISTSQLLSIGVALGALFLLGNRSILKRP